MCVPAPACRAALDEATRLWPHRLWRIADGGSDGICGDARHQAKVSDHNTGDAFDLTHDPARGCDAHLLAESLTDGHDRRVKYVISRRRIWNPARDQPGVWRRYTGENPHDKHCHVSIHPEHRGDTSPWWPTPELEEELMGYPPLAPSWIDVSSDSESPFYVLNVQDNGDVDVVAYHQPAEAHRKMLLRVDFLVFGLPWLPVMRFPNGARNLAGEARQVLGLVEHPNGQVRVVFADGGWPLIVH